MLLNARRRTTIEIVILTILSGTAMQLTYAGQLEPFAGDGRVVLATDRPEFFLGENVLIHYCIENPSEAEFVVSLGGDYRGAPRSQRFEMTVTDESGAVMPDPYPSGSSLGGLGGAPRLGPGDRACQSLPLVRYARIDREGQYRVRVVHDLGWPAGTAPAGETTIAFTMPTAAEAEGVINAMEALPAGPNNTMGETSDPYADFSALRYQVYLGPLEQRALAGSEAAIAGIRVIPIPEATRTLIRLFDHEQPSISRLAARALASRLPDPELEGALPARSPFVDGQLSEREYLRNAGWREEFAPEVREIARQLLLSPQAEDVPLGAFLIQAIGETADAVDVSAALTRSIDRIPLLPPEEGVYPRPRGATSELIRAGEVLVQRGYIPTTPGTTVGDIALWIVAFGQGARPDGWERELESALVHPSYYVRELALDRLPVPVPPSLVERVGENLFSGDVDVQIAASRVVTRGRVAELGALVRATFEDATEDWLLNAAGNAVATLEGPFRFYEIYARRLADPTFSYQALHELLNVFAHDGPSVASLEALSAEEASALSERWLEFLESRRGEVSAGRRIPIGDSGVDGDLLPSGWLLYQDGTPVRPE